MTTDVVTAGSEWETYEAAALMAGAHIRRLVVTEGPVNPPTSSPAASSTTTPRASEATNSS